jgi:hypothetical protein
MAVLLTCVSIGEALAWGSEGHSVIAEIAQRRLSPDASAAVAQVLGQSHSLASIASWADDVRDDRPETYNWHFVDIPSPGVTTNLPSIARKLTKAIA